MGRSIAQVLEETVEDIKEEGFRPQPSEYIWLWDNENNRSYLARADSTGRLRVTGIITNTVDADVTDRWSRELGQIDLARYRGTNVGSDNPVDTQTIVAGAPVDPRDRNWNLDSDEDSIDLGSSSLETTNPVYAYDWRLQERLRKILVELKLLNLQVATVTGDEVHAVDLDEVVS